MSFFGALGRTAQLNRSIRELEAVTEAMNKSQAVIEFTLDGTIITANQNFLTTLGYTATEIEGCHHRIFVDPQDAASPAYEHFWSKLRSGEFIAEKFRRIAKDGTDVWIQASYNPVMGEDGKPVKVIKFATDVTVEEMERRARAVADEASARAQASIVEAVGMGLSRLQAGDLTARLSGEFAGEYAKIQSDFNVALETLQDTVATIASATESIQSGSGEVSHAADDLSRRTEQQAASLEETAAALDEITATVRKTAEGANHARDVVASAKTDAERSGQVVREAVQAMAAIDGSARQISSIIGVIDEIAFQTNLLALNAGVEAARAGDAGKGFAVVASEVRALAQRSADAAKEIKALIGASSAQVASGVDLVGQTGKSLERIVAQVSDLNAVVLEIAASAKEQATGLAEVNVAVNQMDQVTQQNAAMVEQTTAASHALTGDASELGRLVARFEIGVEGAKAGPARSAPVKAAPARPALVRTTPASGRPAPATHRPATVAALRHSGGPGASAVRKPDPAPASAAEPEGWEEF